MGEEEEVLPNHLAKKIHRANHSHPLGCSDYHVEEERMLVLRGDLCLQQQL